MSRVILAIASMIRCQGSVDPRIGIMYLMRMSRKLIRVAVHEQHPEQRLLMVHMATARPL